MAAEALSGSASAGRWRLALAALPPYLVFGACLGLLQIAIPSILQAEGLAANRVSLLALLYLPLAFSAFWAPLVDRYDPLGWGRRRSWFVLAQAAIAGALAAIALAGPAAIAMLLAAMGVMSVAAATMDVVLDGAVAESGDTDSRALRGGLKVSGMLVGTVLGASGMIALIGRLGWAPSILALAALVVVATLPFAVSPLGRNDGDRRSFPSLRAFVRLPGIGQRSCLVVVLGLALGTGLSVPRLTMVANGYPLGLVGHVFGTVGPLVAAAGAVAGLSLGQRFGLVRTLLGGAALFALATAAASSLLSGAAATASTSILTAAIAGAAFAYAVLYGTVSSLAMGWIGSDQAATDYAIFQNLWLLAILVGTALAGGFYTGIGVSVLVICGALALAAAAGLALGDRPGRALVVKGRA